MSNESLMRIAIVIAGAILMLAIWYFGRPRKSPQGARVDRRAHPGQPADRREPVLGAVESPAVVAEPAAAQAEVDLAGPASVTDELGKRASEEFDKIVTLYIAARAGKTLHGPDIVVAAEKAGLTYGHMNVFHRLVESHPEQGPIFSVANVMKPGSFEMGQIQELRTPAIAFFLTLPAPVSALDAWEMMQPAAERMAELLDGVVLDEQRNALGRQRVQHLREEMRAYDREREAAAAAAKPAARW